jgi:hypothetical protein
MHFGASRRCAQDRVDIGGTNRGAGIWVGRSAATPVRSGPERHQNGNSFQADALLVVAPKIEQRWCLQALVLVVLRPRDDFKSACGIAELLGFALPQGFIELEHALHPIPEGTATDMCR